MVNLEKNIIHSICSLYKLLQTELVGPPNKSKIFGFDNWKMLASCTLLHTVLRVINFMFLSTKYSLGGIKVSQDKRNKVLELKEGEKL
jgi:hypothetical protein